MSASIPTIAVAPTAGVAAPIGVGAGAPGVLGVFDALLAGMFGEPVGATGGDLGLVNGGASASSVSTAVVDGTTAFPEIADASVETPPTDATSPGAVADANLALLALAAAPAVPVSSAPGAQTQGSDETKTPPAWGTDKAPGLAAAPALAHAHAAQNAAAHADTVHADASSEAEIARPADQLEIASADATATAPDVAPAIAAAKPRGRQAAPATTGADVARPAAIVSEAAPETPAAQSASKPVTGVQDTARPAAAPEPQTAAADLPSLAAAAAQTPPPAPKAAGKRDRAEAHRDISPSAETPVAPRTGGAAGVPTTATAMAHDAADDIAPLETAASGREAPDPVDRSAGSDGAGAVTQTNNTLAPAHAAGPAPVRGAPETVAHLAAQIVKKLEGRSTRFDIELDPIGLGKVDVRVDIGAHGRVTAAMSFDNPQAAAELRSRAGELQRALEQAGFDLSGGLSFDVAGDQGRSGQGGHAAHGEAGAAFRGRAFQAALDTAGDAAQAAVGGALNLRRGVASGVDVRI